MGSQHRSFKPPARTPIAGAMPRTLIAVAVAFAALLCAVPALAAPPAVHVEGNTLVDSGGQPVRLLGVNRSGAEYACIQGWGFFDGPVDDASVAAIARWHVNAVRIPLNEACWLGLAGAPVAYSGAGYRQQIADLVARLNRAGLVAVLDLHWSTAGSAPATGQQLMADAAHAPGFWRSVAGRFRDDPGVVFDLYNEPHDIGWDCWRNGCTTSGGWRAAGMQSLVDAVRSTGARQPVIATSNGWGNDLSGWLAHRPGDPLGQLVAGIHLYDFTGCADAACWSRDVAAIARAVPVVTSELGERDCGHSFIDEYMDWADAVGVSYLAWTWDTWSCSGGPALIRDYDGTPTAFGAGFRDHLTRLARSPRRLSHRRVRHRRTAPQRRRGTGRTPR
jgi:endoglucanase